MVLCGTQALRAPPCAKQTQGMVSCTNPSPSYPCPLLSSSPLSLQQFSPHIEHQILGLVDLLPRKIRRAQYIQPTAENAHETLEVTSGLRLIRELLCVLYNRRAFLRRRWRSFSVFMI